MFVASSLQQLCHMLVVAKVSIVSFFLFILSVAT